MSNVKQDGVKVKFEARLCFPDLFEPDEKYNRYGASFPAEPGSAVAKALDAAQLAAATEKWGAKAADILARLQTDGKTAFKHRSKTNKDGDVYDGFQGCHTLDCSQDSPRPTVLDRDKSPLTKADGRPYGGCYVVAIVRFWAQDNSWGRRVNCELAGVQFVRDGDSFSGGAAARADEFDDLADHNEEEDLA